MSNIITRLPPTTTTTMLTKLSNALVMLSNVLATQYDALETPSNGLAKQSKMHHMKKNFE